MSHFPSPPPPPALPSLTPERAAMLDAFLDGTLAGEDLAAFQTLVASDSSLRAHVDAQRRVDASLKRVYAVDDSRLAEGLKASLARAANSPRPGNTGSAVLTRLRWYAAAAVIGLVAVVGFRYYVHLHAPAGPRELSPDQVYARMEARQFEPEFVCTTDEEFARTVKDKFGQPLLVAVTPSIKLVGWGYGNAYSGRIVGDNTLVLITRVDDAPVLMFMDKASNDRTLKVPKESKVHVFRRKVGSMVLYEVTPLDAPRLLERTYNPESSPRPS